MKLSLLLFVVLGVCVGSVVSTACSGSPKKLNGVPCASTTRYWDGQKGACGYVTVSLLSSSSHSFILSLHLPLSCRCGTADSNTNPFSWQWNQHTAAASAPIFGTATWCGTGCGMLLKHSPIHSPIFAHTHSPHNEYKESVMNWRQLATLLLAEQHVLIAIPLLSWWQICALKMAMHNGAPPVALIHMGILLTTSISTYNTTWLIVKQ